MAQGRRRLAWSLAIPFCIVFVGSVALFWRIELGLTEQSDDTRAYFKSEWGEVSTTLGNVAGAVFYLCPLVVGALAYAAVVLVPPLRLRRSGWRFLLGVPAAALSSFALWFVMLAPWIFLPNRYS